MSGKRYLLDIPEGMSDGERYPLVVTLSPAADARGMIGFWRNLSRRYGLIILASREYRNGIDVIPVIDDLAEIIRTEIIGAYPVDCGKIIATGFSGGGMGAHAFSCEHRDLISAVIVNTCMMNGRYVDQYETYPAGKRAVFIASPADFRYGEMQQDHMFLQRLRWKTLWLEFPGGHRVAPEPVYDEALAWLLGELA